MDINDYLIATKGLNWPRLLADWMPPLPARFRVWIVNRLGDVLAVTDDKSVLRLDLGSGTCAEIARSPEHFAELLNAPKNADEWLRIRLVDECRRAGLELGPGECYGFKIPPTLGGQYEVANLTPTKLAIHYSYQAYICKQADVYWIPPPA